MSPLDPPRCLSAPARGSVLVLAPHPDDEVIGVGGTLALHARQGDRVHVVVAFDGAAGLPTMAPGQARDLRCREALAGGRALSSLTSALTHQFLEFPEGHEPTDAELQRGAALLARILIERRPTSVYAPWPGDAHQDHRVLAAALALALEQLPVHQRPKYVWGFEVWSTLEASVLLDVTPVMDMKRAALECHASQSTTNLTRRALGLAAWRSAHLDQDQRYAEALCPFPPASSSELNPAAAFPSEQRA
ncbi:MAG: PIG-L deacetylase family protein [Planctomycetota bacterium]|nr:PIG-L deacetylase family protein [Planctomycetota bacterium]